MTCAFAHHDGAYVLGALSPAERLDFERHLPGCPDCTRSVQELAGLPGLLARVTPDVLDAVAVDTPVPESLLPRLVREVRRTERRRTWVTAVMAAAAALLVTLGTLAATGVLDDDRPATESTSVTPPKGLAMEPVPPQRVTAELALTGVPWGTRLDLTCTYTSHEGEWATQAPTYALFIRTREGEVERVATWRALPGRTMRLAAATATSRDDIASVEVRTADGTRVAKLVA
jgi:hypothetical protein